MVNNYPFIHAWLKVSLQVVVLLLQNQPRVILELCTVKFDEFVLFIKPG